MNQFQVHTLETAPERSTASLKSLQDGLGFVPNLAATMAESPTLVNGFVELRQTLARSELTPVEREIVAIAVSVENDCDYCVAAHSTFARMQGGDEAAVAAARDGALPDDARLAAIYRLGRGLVANHGHASPEDIEAVLDAGFSAAAVLDVVAQVAHTSMANYTHNVAGVDLDEAFQPQAWAGAAA